MSQPFQSKPLISPLRYPGSKRRLVSYVREALVQNNLRPKLYIEMFAGGASVALQLMEDDLVEKVILVDRDPLIAGFWKTVFRDSAWLIDQVATIDVTVEQWLHFKQMHATTRREKALQCLFLNRTSFSGIMRDEVGPIGGRRQNSEYPIDCRFPRATLIKRIEQAAALSRKVVKVWGCSWNEGVKRIKEQQISGTLPQAEVFYYLDPPFFEKANKLYRYFFTHADHQRLRDYLLLLNDHWLLSYDSVQEVEALYGEALANRHNGTHRRSVELLYSTSLRPGSQPATEIVLTNLKHLPSQTRLWKSSNNEQIK